MFDISIISFVLFFLVIIQSIAGVGILVIGTPFLLIIDYNITDILSLLLPISIITSMINLIFFKLNKKKLKMKINSNTKNLFFFVCVPSIFVGIYFLQLFQNQINFKILVSVIIIISLILANSKIFISKINFQIKVLFLSLTGIIHGVTNSGGTLLSLFMSSHLKKSNSRYSITFFYFFLALFQFLIFNFFFIFDVNSLNYTFLCVIIPIGVAFGNFIVNYINENKFKNLISILSLIACFFLVFNE